MKITKKWLKTMNKKQQILYVIRCAELVFPTFNRQIIKVSIPSYIVDKYGKIGANNKIFKN